MQRPDGENRHPDDRRCRCCGDPCDVQDLTHCRACWEAECIPPLGCSKEMTDA